MSASADRIEANLCVAYREEAELYEQALALSPQPDDGGIDGRLPALTGLLDRIAAIESRVAPDRDQWQRAGRLPGPELAGCLARIAELLRGLSAVVEQAISHVQTQRDQMMPQVEGLARLSRMQQAYHRVSQGPSHGQAVP